MALFSLLSFFLLLFLFPRLQDFVVLVAVLWWPGSFPSFSLGLSNIATTLIGQFSSIMIINDFDVFLTNKLNPK
jgi:hypothetical protein